MTGYDRSNERAEAFTYPDHNWYGTQLVREAEQDALVQEAPGGHGRYNVRLSVFAGQILHLRQVTFLIIMLSMTILILFSTSAQTMAPEHGVPDASTSLATTQERQQQACTLWEGTVVRTDGIHALQCITR